MKTRNEKNKFLNELRDVPVVSIICKRTGISKSTVYRWLKNDKGFRIKFNEALGIGRDSISDLAESTIINAMRKGSLRAAEYWLSTNAKRYYQPRKPIQADKPVHLGVTGFKITGLPEWITREHIDKMEEEKKKQKEAEQIAEDIQLNNDDGILE